MNNRIIIFLLAILLSPMSGCSQHENFDEMLKDLLDFTVPTMTVQQLDKQMKKEKVYVLDAREFEEYKISHIKGAKYVGYDNFNKKRVQSIPKNATVVLYCSVGYRSEKVGEQLQKMGFTKVYNLYGSIFEWVNNGYPVVDKNNQPTNKVHTYSRKWSKWLKKGEKVY